ncbi:hypothetical protein ACWCWQ_34065 [Streptomyces sp. NPDC001571]
MRRRRRAVAAGLAVTAAALAVSSPQAAERTHPPAAPAPRERGPAREARMLATGARVVSAPVRIADAETVRLLRPGDLVDVIAAADPPSPSGGEARVLATGARVERVPGAGNGAPEAGALIVLAVPRETARVLVGAGPSSRLAVTLC